MNQDAAAEFDRARLKRQARRMEQVISALKDRAIYRHASTGTAPAPLRQAIAAFELELSAIRRRLGELS